MYVTVVQPALLGRFSNTVVITIVMDTEPEQFVSLSPHTFWANFDLNTCLMLYCSQRIFHGLLVYVLVIVS